MSWIDEYLTSGKAIDISVTLRDGLAQWPGENLWAFDPVARMDEGDPCNVSRIGLSLHTGTHVDAPWHFGKGTRTVESTPLDQMITPARVLDLTHVSTAITRADLEGRIDGARAVLCKTTNSGSLERQEPFDEDFVHLSEDAAQYIVERGVRTIGVDYLSVEGFEAATSGNAVAHHALLGADVFIVEGLDLSAVDAGEYLLVVLPLKVEGGDGAPARAVLLR
jgi:arylformamidase